MIHFFVFSRRNLTSRFLLITSLQPERFHAITHSFPQRRSAIYCIFNSFRTLFIAIGVGTPAPLTSVQESKVCSLLPCFHTLTNCFPPSLLLSHPYKTLGVYYPVIPPSGVSSLRRSDEPSQTRSAMFVSMR